MDRDEPWFGCLASCETRVPCGQGEHTVRWEDGTLRLPAHPDAEAEQVLAALGGEKARCIEVAEAWARHADDLSVLLIGPRGPADEIQVSWEDVDAAAAGGPARHGPARRGPIRHGPIRHGPMQAGPVGLRTSRTDMLSLLALGYEFQVRLAAQVAAAHAGGLDAKDQGGGRIRPALVAALAGRLGPAAEDWLGIAPGQVSVTLHHGPGWGSAELTGERALRVSLPPGWLARVWAPGLALAGQHLVVAVDRPGWPDARVLALPAPGADPVLLDVHAREATGAGGAAGTPDWEV